MAQAKNETIVVGIDYSEASQAAFDAAVRIAQTRSSGPLHAVSVLGGYDPMGKMELAYESHHLNLDAEKSKLSAHVNAELERYLSEHGGAEVRIEPHVLAGPAAKEIARVASQVRADLVVVGSHGRRGVKRMVLGSVAEEVLRVARCPVLVMRRKDWSKVH